MTPEDLQKLFRDAPEPPAPFFRLYHDTEGRPLFYSMADEPGTYIELTPEEYHRGSSNVRVRNGKLVEVTWATTTKLVPGNSGPPCHPDNVAVIVAEDQPHTKWSKQTYESN
jgi:hypothetical protein